ncbi:bifunctional hydroxymethylpyrimidine kinase/phosphomethylpyrimidine kinase [Mesorhizobium sp. M0518]|uniref:bifunctional hydroxymethylpyrimidine kinase/phosphomethylpyrimidine kinase n=1 Tax=Mesorhizobium sp. M0518 TaxID=2956956 RepID=UPI003337C56E
MISIDGLNLTGSKAFFEAGAESAAVVTDLAMNDAPEARTREWIERQSNGAGARTASARCCRVRFPRWGWNCPRIETIACLDVRTCLAVSALTVQTHQDALEIQVTQPGLVADQMRAALQANRVAGTKVGMLATAEIIVAAVAAVLREYRAHIDSPDPVLASTSGERFLKQAPSRIMK